MSTALDHQTSQSVPPVDSEFQDKVGARRILIVDDEASVRNMFADYLSDTYECVTAASADEALAHLAADSFALVISDMTMPGRNGVKLLREVTSRYADTVVIMVSGVDRPQRVRDALRVGAFDYLIKPASWMSWVFRLSVLSNDGLCNSPPESTKPILKRRMLNCREAKPN